LPFPTLPSPLLLSSPLKGVPIKSGKVRVTIPPHSNSLPRGERGLQGAFQSAIINMVVVDRPSPTSKKRPAAAGLFLL